MTLQERITSHFVESMQAKQDTLATLNDTIAFAAQKMVSALLNDHKI